MVDDPIDAGDYGGVGALAVAVEDAHAMEGDPFCDAGTGAAEDPGDVSAVAVWIRRAPRAAPSRVVAREDSSSQVWMSRINASVEDGDNDSGTRAHAPGIFGAELVQRPLKVACSTVRFRSTEDLARRHGRTILLRGSIMLDPAMFSPTADLSAP